MTAETDGLQRLLEAFVDPSLQRVLERLSGLKLQAVQASDGRRSMAVQARFGLRRSVFRRGCREVRLRRRGWDSWSSIDSIGLFFGGGEPFFGGAGNHLRRDAGDLLFWWRGKNVKGVGRIGFCNQG